MFVQISDCWGQQITVRSVMNWYVYQRVAFGKRNAFRPSHGNPCVTNYHRRPTGMHVRVLCVFLKFLLSGRLFLHIYVFNDICCHF